MDWATILAIIINCISIVLLLLAFINKLEEAHQKHNKEINEMMKKMRENPDEYEQTEFENKIMDHVNMHSYLPIDSRTHKKLNDLMKNEEFPKLTD